MGAWPELSYAAWQPTGASLHQWLQIVGKYRLTLSPWLNHSWHATFYVTPRGLTTSTVYKDAQAVELAFDLVDHALVARTSDGAEERLRLEPMSVATFHARFLELLDRLRLKVAMHGAPNEIADAVPFASNTATGSYDGEAAERFWRALLQIDRVFQHFRTGFIGKSSPVHLFWGSLDLAVTRFSGRKAPPHPGGVPALPDRVTREAYSHEVSSAGFWAGGGGVDEAAFYAYAYPTPAGFGAAPVAPTAAKYDERLGEFVLPYEAVRRAGDPEGTLLAFLQTTYEAAADLAGWDRQDLERALGEPGRVPS